MSVFPSRYCASPVTLPCPRCSVWGKTITKKQINESPHVVRMLSREKDTELEGNVTPVDAVVMEGLPAEMMLEERAGGSGS